MDFLKWPRKGFENSGKQKVILIKEIRIRRCKDIGRESRNWKVIVGEL